MTNIQLATLLIETLVEQGVRRFCVCAGARNAPILEVLDRSSTANTELQIKSFFDERSAAFFALGLIKELGEPTAVVTTSGTAVAELLPAAVEAFYSGLPLVLVTADRPRRFRGSAAPQAIEQNGIFSGYARRSYDIESEWANIYLAELGATHINICFDEPLVDGSIQPIHSRLGGARRVHECSNDAGHDERIAAFFSRVKRPLVVVGGTPEASRGAIVELLSTLHAPVYAEAQSGLREHAGLKGVRLLTPAILTAKTFREHFDGVLRIGSVPTLRLWRDFDLTLNDVPILSFHHLPFSGLAREHQPALPLSHLFSFCSRNFERGFFEESAVRNADKIAAQKLAELLLKFSHSEAGLVRQLSELISPEAMIFLGNSLPIREWDLTASLSHPHARVLANRGANGIDGLISTFLGAASATAAQESWLILGDLSALYDLNALAISASSAAEMKKKIRIVVINNSGGQIFSRMFTGSKFLNAHNFSFENWAEMFGFDYAVFEPRASEVSFVKTFEDLGSRAVIEFRPDNRQSDNFWCEWETATVQEGHRQ